MTASLLDVPSTIHRSPSPASNLRDNMAAVRVSFTWLGTRKSLTPEQRAEAAQPFDAEGQSLSAAKKILDNRHPAFRAVTAIRGKIASAWKSMSLPFPEPGGQADQAGSPGEILNLIYIGCTGSQPEYYLGKEDTQSLD